MNEKRHYRRFVMNRSMVLVVLSLFLTTAALGNNSPAVRWGHQLMSETDDVPRAAAVDGEGGIYFAFIKAVKDAPGLVSAEVQPRGGAVVD
jgi:hypothetical protein